MLAEYCFLNRIEIVPQDGFTRSNFCKVSAKARRKCSEETYFFQSTKRRALRFRYTIL